MTFITAGQGIVQVQSGFYIKPNPNLPNYVNAEVNLVQSKFIQKYTIPGIVLVHAKLYRVSVTNIIFTQYTCIWNVAPHDSTFSLLSRGTSRIGQKHLQPLLETLTDIKQLSINHQSCQCLAFGVVIKIVLYMKTALPIPYKISYYMTIT